MIKQVIWDWNGTLLNDLDLCIDVINRILKEEGLSCMNKDEYQRVFQFPVIEYYKKAGFDFNKTSFEELAKRYMADYQPRSYTCNLQTGAIEALKQLQEKNISQYILSASKIELLKQQLNQYPIEHYFLDVFGLDNIHAHSKKELAKDVVTNHKMKIEETIFIGDSVHDAQVAAYAGCKCILITTGHEHKEKLLQTNQPVFDTMQECVDYILKQ